MSGEVKRIESVVLIDSRQVSPLLTLQALLEALKQLWPHHPPSQKPLDFYFY